MLDVSKYIGIPFKDGGSDTSGADCWGLVQMVYSDVFDTDLPHYSISALDVGRVIDAMQEARDQGLWEEVSKGDYQQGDVVALAMHPKYRDFVNHVGIFVGKNSFLHTQEKHGAIISPMNCVIYSRLIKGVYRWVT